MAEVYVHARRKGTRQMNNLKGQTGSGSKIATPDSNFQLHSLFKLGRGIKHILMNISMSMGRQKKKN